MECFEWSVGTEKNSMLVVPSAHMSSVKKLFCFGGVLKTLSQFDQQGALLPQSS